MNMNVSYKVLGIMSGTSLDGIDLVISTFTKKEKWSFSIDKTKTIKYSNYWIKILSELHKKDNPTRHNYMFNNSLFRRSRKIM